MEISGIDHVGIVTANIEESSVFYVNFLGFTPGEIEEAKDLKLRMRLLQKGENTLELLEPESKEGATFGLRHIALRCSNIDGVFEEAARQNLKLLHKSPAQHGNTKFFFCKGVDGVLIEFVENT